MKIWNHLNVEQSESETNVSVMGYYATTVHFGLNFFCKIKKF